MWFLLKKLSYFFNLNDLQCLKTIDTQLLTGAWSQSCSLLIWSSTIFLFVWDIYQFFILFFNVMLILCTICTWFLFIFEYKGFFERLCLNFYDDHYIIFLKCLRKNIQHSSLTMETFDRYLTEWKDCLLLKLECNFWNREWLLIKKYIYFNYILVTYTYYSMC